jgi:hypothetical protein
VANSSAVRLGSGLSAVAVEAFVNIGAGCPIKRRMFDEEENEKRRNGFYR